MGSLVWKVLAAGSAAVAGMAAGKVVDTLWRTAGRDVPANPQNPQDSGWGEAVGYAAVSALAVAVAQVLAQRKAATYYAQSAGHLPKALQS